MRLFTFLALLATASLLVQCSPPTVTTRVPLPTPILPDTGLSALAVRPSAGAITGAAREPVAWRYRFTPGEKLHYRKTWIQQSVPAGDYHHMTEALIEIESVDAAGNATMTITILEEIQQDDLRGIRQPAEFTGKKIYSSYAQSIPKVRVVVDPYGRFVSGQVLEEAADHLEFLERAKQPGSHAWSISDDKRLAYAVEKWFPILTVRESTGVGDRWIDTLIQNRTGTRISLDGGDTTSDGNGSTDKNDRTLPGVTHFKSQIREYNEYRVAPMVEQGGATYVKVEATAILEQDLAEDRMHVARTTGHNLFRATDGMPALLKSITHSGSNGEQSTYHEVVLELLPD